MSEFIEIRRHLHAHPELSLEEFETARFIRETLGSFGIEDVQIVAETGVVALVEGAHPGPTFAWRADIDALPILEANEVSYCSKNAGVMHACGHDVHTTVGLGIARALHERRDELRGRVKFIFQPAEEASPENEPIGAERMVREGVLENPAVDAVFAVHCMPTLEVGKIGYTGGAVWACSELVEIEIFGEKTHGAYPHMGIDAVTVASHVVVALQTIVSRRIDAREACVLSIGQISAGNSYNIIADKAELTGIVRTLSNETLDRAKGEVVQIVEGVCQAFGASSNVRFTPGARLTANDESLEREVVEILKISSGAEQVVAHLPQLGAEDFAAFSTRVPGCYLFLGVRNEDKGITHMIHTPHFDVDEEHLRHLVDAKVDAVL
ncbi:MAG: M20 metallopeptidase family protein, partial [Bradymonadaceae bacterium]